MQNKIQRSGNLWKKDSSAEKRSTQNSSLKSIRRHLKKNSPADTDMQRNWSHLMTSCAMPACWPYSAMQDCIIFWPFYFLLLHRTAVLFPIGPQGWRVGARKCNCTEHPEAAASTVQFQPAIVMVPECIFMMLAVSIR